MSPQFWPPPSELVQRGTFTSGAAAEVVTFLVPFASFPDVQFTLTATANVVVVMTALSGTAMTVYCVNVTSGAQYPGQAVRWTARARP